MGVTAGTVQAGVKSVQRGAIYTNATVAGTNPEMRYTDVTISAVNTAKARVVVDAVLAGGASSAASNTKASENDRYQSAAAAIAEAFGYLLNSTTLRIYGGNVSGPGYTFSGRWEVIEDF